MDIAMTIIIALLIGFFITFMYLFIIASYAAFLAMGGILVFTIMLLTTGNSALAMTVLVYSGLIFYSTLFLLGVIASFRSGKVEQEPEVIDQTDQRRKALEKEYKEHRIGYIKYMAELYKL